MNIEGAGHVSKKNIARRSTATGRIVYDRKPHLFDVQDVLRILNNLITEGQLSYFDRAKVIAQVIASGALETIEAILDILRGFVLADGNLGVMIATWLVNLGQESVNTFLMAWAKARGVK